MIEYFKQDTPFVRTTVNGVFAKIAAECASTTAGVSTHYCSDPYRNCGGGSFAWASSFPTPYVTYRYCPSFFPEIAPLRKECHRDDQPFVVIHELTHLNPIKGTSDFGVYGYQAAMRLTAQQNLNHADTYALFSNAIDVGLPC